MDIEAAVALALVTGVLALPMLGLTRLPTASLLSVRASLTRLDVGVNDLSSLPGSVGQLAGLEELLVNGNPRLTSLPSELAACGRLRLVDVRDCGAPFRFPPELCALSASLAHVAADAPRLKPSQGAAYAQGGTRALLAHLEARSERRALRAALEAALAAGVYRQAASTQAGRASLEALCRAVTARLPPAVVRGVVRHADRLFPARLQDASPEALREGHDALARETARRGFGADVELKLRSRYWGDGGIPPAAVEPLVAALLAALPELDDVLFLLQHASALLPARWRDLDARRMGADVAALRGRLAAEREAAVAALVASLTRLYADQDAGSVAAVAGELASGVRGGSDDVRALASDLADVCPPDWTGLRPTRVLATWAALRADKGLG